MRAPIRSMTWTLFDEKDIAPYRAINGSSNSDVDHQWNELLDSMDVCATNFTTYWQYFAIVGAIKMDEAAKKRLPMDTARVYGEEFYAGILEFEHQWAVSIFFLLAFHIRPWEPDNCYWGEICMYLAKKALARSHSSYYFIYFYFYFLNIFRDAGRIAFRLFFFFP